MLDHKDVKEQMENLLREGLEPMEMDIRDDSQLHAGHAESVQGGHFYLKVVSKKFENLSLLERERLIHSILGAMIGKEIHALSVKCEVP